MLQLDNVFYIKTNIKIYIYAVAIFYILYETRKKKEDNY